MPITHEIKKELTRVTGDARYLMLDQTTPQTVSGGLPTFALGLKLGSSTDYASVVGGLGKITFTDYGEGFNQNLSIDFDSEAHVLVLSSTSDTDEMRWDANPAFGVGNAIFTTKVFNATTAVYSSYLHSASGSLTLDVEGVSDNLILNAGITSGKIFLNAPQGTEIDTTLGVGGIADFQTAKDVATEDINLFEYGSDPGAVYNSSAFRIWWCNPDSGDGCFHFDDGAINSPITLRANLYANQITLAAGNDIRPSGDTTSAINIAQADGTDFVTFDTTNKRVGIGTTAPGYKLDVYGTAATDVVSSDIGFNVSPVVKPSTLTLALIEEVGNVDAGKHYYALTYYTAIGETELHTLIGPYVTTDATHGKVLVTMPTSSDSKVIGRKIYRSEADGNYYSDIKLVATITNNTETEYIDNIADADRTGNNSYYLDNSTCKFFMSNDVPAFYVSTKNTILGAGAGKTILNGTAVTSSNTIIGVNAGDACTTGTANTVIGNSALTVNTTGYANVIVGDGAGSQETQSYSTIVGRNAGFNTAGVYNTIVGGVAGFGSDNLSTGNNNTFIGYHSGYSYTDGYNNSALGYYALSALTQGAGNAAVGLYSLTNLTTTNYNSALGYAAGRYIGAAPGTTACTTLSNSIMIGFDARPAADGEINEIVIGASATGLGSNTTVLGNSSITKTAIYGNVGIGSTAPDRKLEINTGAATGGIRLTYNDSDGSAATYGDILIDSAGEVSFHSTGGLQIGTATTDLIGFYNATPVDQPATVSDAATQDLTGTDTVDQTKLEADLTSCKNAINSLIDRLQEVGLIA